MEPVVLDAVQKGLLYHHLSCRLNFHDFFQIIIHVPLHQKRFIVARLASGHINIISHLKSEWFKCRRRQDRTRAACTVSIKRNTTLIKILTQSLWPTFPIWFFHRHSDSTSKLRLSNDLRLPFAFAHVCMLCSRFPDSPRTNCLRTNL